MKNWRKIVYVLANQCRIPFDLTNFRQKISFRAFHFRAFYPKLVGTSSRLIVSKGNTYEDMTGFCETKEQHPPPNQSHHNFGRCCSPFARQIDWLSIHKSESKEK